MGLIVVANTKGGAGKTTSAIHLIAPWVYSRIGKATVVELDDENTDTRDFNKSKITTQQIKIGKETAAFIAIEQLIEKSVDDLLIVDVGGNRTCDLCLKTALRRWVWNSLSELSQNIASILAGGTTWTAPRF